jgi:hypothetical protein
MNWRYTTTPYDGQIAFRALSTGYIFVRGCGPLQYAQWPSWRSPDVSDFHPEASPEFRAAVTAALAESEET